MPARDATTRYYLGRDATAPWTLELTVPDVDPATGLVQAAFGAEATADPLDLTGVHQVITTAVQGGHSGIIVQRGTTADGNGTAILRFVLPAASVAAFTATGMPYSVRVWESASSHWTEFQGWVSSATPASSLTGLLSGVVLVLTTITLTPNPASVAASGTVQFTAAYLDQNGAPMDMTGIAAGTWASSIPADATIDANGLATWVSEGLTQITHTRGGVTSAAVPLTTGAAVAATGFAPDLSWHTVTDGYYPNTRVNLAAAMQVNVESFGGGALVGTEYDAGDGTYRLLTHTAPTGLLAGAYGTQNNGWAGWYNPGTMVDLPVAMGARAPGQQWDRIVRTAAVGADWEAPIALLVGVDQVLGGVDTPPRLGCKFWVRGTAGNVLRYYVHINGGATLVPITALPAFVEGVEQQVAFEFEFPTALVSGQSIDIRLTFLESGGWTAGEYFEAANAGFFRAQLFDEPDRYIFPVAAPSGSGNALGLGNNLTGPQNNLPLHRTRGLQIFGSGGACQWGKAITDITNVEGAYWTPTNWTSTVTATPGPLSDLIPVGSPGRFWFRSVVAAGGTLAKAGTFGLPHMTGYVPESTAIDTPTPGTVAGRRAWVHMTARDNGGRFPANGEIAFRLTGTGTYTGLCRVLRDSPTSSSYHLLFPVNVAADNVVTAFTGAFENVSGVALDFDHGPVWIEREVWNPINGRNAGGPDQWMPPRMHYGPNATGDTADTMKRARADLSEAFDVWHHTTVMRYWFGFDPEDVRGRPSAQVKWIDTGPNASSALTYLYELITDAAGAMTFRVYIAHSGGGIPAGNKNHQIDWQVPVGLFRAYDFNDVSVTVDNVLGITQVYVNGTWLDLTTPGVQESYRVLPTVNVTTSGAAALGATSIPVNALSGTIPSGTVLVFAPSNVSATTTAEVVAGAVAIPVAALAGAIAAAETSAYATHWTLNGFTPLWFGMDRDLDCSIKSWLTAFEFVNAPQTRAAIAQRCVYLNSLGTVGTVTP